MKRRIPFSATPNARDIGGYPTADGKTTKYGVFYRSGYSRGFDERDAQLLKEHNIGTVVELRSEAETAAFPDALCGGERAAYLHFPLPGAMPQKASDVPALYMTLAQNDNMTEVFRTLANAASAVLFHCSAGKDRTGTVAAVLMMLADVAEEDIVADYVITYAYYFDNINRFIEMCPEMEKEVAMPLPQHMQGFLRLFREKFGNAENYLLKIGLSPAEVETLKRKLK